MQTNHEYWEKRRKQTDKEEEKNGANKLKRFDEVFRMLLLVMTITTSIGLSSYTGLDLFFTLVYFITSLCLWMFANLVGTNVRMYELEVFFKLHAWVLALLVTLSTFARFTLKVSSLNPMTKLVISIATFTVTFLSYRYFEDTTDSHNRRRHFIIDFVILSWFLGNTLVL
jgi:hypothetical protein